MDDSERSPASETPLAETPPPLETPPSPQPPPLPPRPTMGANLSETLWAQLLSPLPLGECFPLETVCRTFSRVIYSGQTRFVWNEKFKAHLSLKDRTQNWHLREEMLERFLDFICPRIAPYLRKIILKVNSFPPNYFTIFSTLSGLDSVYLKVASANDHWRYFVSSGYLPPSYQAELRIVATNFTFITDNNQPWYDVSFLTSLTHGRHLTSLQLWKLELKNAPMMRQIFLLPALKKYRLYLNETVCRRFLPRFAAAHGHCLETLYIYWEVNEPITGQQIATFSQAMAQCTKLITLSLLINWPPVHFQSRDEGLHFDDKWSVLVHQHLPASLEKLTIDVASSNQRSRLKSRALIASVLKGRKWKLIRLLVSHLMDVFPFNLPVVSVETIELSLHYMKNFRCFGTQLGYYNYLPKWISRQVFLFDWKASSEQARNSVKSLKLCLFPLFDIFIAEHVALCFPQLEMFSFSGFCEGAYDKGVIYYRCKDENGKEVTTSFTESMKTFIQTAPSLRVIKLADKWTTKPWLNFMVELFLERAKTNPDKMYALYIDWESYCKPEDGLLHRSATEVKNLRVY